MAEDTEEVSSLEGGDADAQGMEEQLDAAITSPLQLLQEKVLNGSQGGVLPKMLGVLRSLHAIPDSDVGLAAWSRLEIVVDAIATTSAKVRASLYEQV